MTRVSNLSDSSKFFFAETSGRFKVTSLCITAAMDYILIVVNSCSASAWSWGFSKEACQSRKSIQRLRPKARKTLWGTQTFTEEGLPPYPAHLSLLTGKNPVTQRGYRFHLMSNQCPTVAQTRVEDVLSLWQVSDDGASSFISDVQHEYLHHVSRACS